VRGRRAARCAARALRGAAGRTARGKHCQPRAAREQLADGRRRVHDLLEVVEDEQHVAIAQLLGEAQHEAVQANIALLRARRGLEMTEKQEAISRG